MWTSKQTLNFKIKCLKTEIAALRERMDAFAKLQDKYEDLLEENFSLKQKCNKLLEEKEQKPDRRAIQWGNLLDYDGRPQPDNLGEKENG